MPPNLQSYPVYKPSGVEWLGDVPAHWEVQRLRTLAANIVDQTTQCREHEIALALEHVESWSGRCVDAGPDMIFESQVKQFQPGDVLFGRLRPYLAKVTCPGKPGVCVGEFLVLRLKDGNMLSGFLWQVLRSKPVIDAINASTFGAKMPRTEWQFIGNMEQSVPPLPEQTAIVRFLDHADRRIRRYLCAKEKLIALLEEQKQAIIHQAVTGRIDVRTGQPYPAYKGSGVALLGKVPAHWGVRRLKQDCRMAYGDALADEKRKDGVVPVLGSNGRVGFHNTANTKGPCIVIGRKGSFGKVNYSRDPVFAIDTTFFIDSRLSSANIRWLFYLLRWLRLDEVTRDSAVPGLDREDAYGRFGAFPPVAEQTAIVRFLDRALADIDAIIARTRRQIELLHEYRTRLIADVVTGKLDVREAAATLPEVDPLAAEDDLDETFGDESEFDSEDEPIEAAD